MADPPELGISGGHPQLLLFPVTQWMTNLTAPAIVNIIKQDFGQITPVSQLSSHPISRI